MSSRCFFSLTTAHSLRLVGGVFNDWALWIVFFGTVLVCPCGDRFRFRDHDRWLASLLINVFNIERVLSAASRSSWFVDGVTADGRRVQSRPSDRDGSRRRGRCPSPMNLSARRLDFTAALSVSSFLSLSSSLAWQHFVRPVATG